MITSPSLTVVAQSGAGGVCTLPSGVGGGNWRVIPNRTPYGPPGVKAEANQQTSPEDDPEVATALASAAPYESILADENFSCYVYSCRLGVVETKQSSLHLYKDDFGAVWARLACFLLLDDFDEYGGEPRGLICRRRRLIL